MMSDLTRQYPNQINVVAIGPLTNIALAMKFDPELPGRLKQLFIMGGNIGILSTCNHFTFLRSIISHLLKHVSQCVNHF